MRASVGYVRILPTLSNATVPGVQLLWTPIFCAWGATSMYRLVLNHKPQTERPSVNKGKGAEVAARQVRLSLAKI